MGIDANAAGLRELSGRAAREGLDNVVYVRAAVEDLPATLAGVADDVTVVLPWGSLLAAVARPSVRALHGIRGLCQPGARLTVVLSVDPARDRAELLRLRLGSLPSADAAGLLAPGYAAAGFVLASALPLRPEDLARWPTTWARRLAYRSERWIVRVEAVAASSGGAHT